MMKRDLILFEKPGKENTEATLRAARARAEALGIKHVVVATTTGETALSAADAFRDMDVSIVGVTLLAGVWDKYAPPDPAKVKQAEERGVTFLTATHTLMGNVGSAIRDKFGGMTQVELIAHTYYTFSQGVKVGVEIALMAADAALVPVDKELISIAGTGGGADTALVITPAYSTKFFDLKINEVIAMPR